MEFLFAWGMVAGVFMSLVLVVRGVGAMTGYREEATPPLGILCGVAGFVAGTAIVVIFSGSWSLDVLPVAVLMAAMFAGVLLPMIRQTFARERAARDSSLSD